MANTTFKSLLKIWLLQLVLLLLVTVVIWWINPVISYSALIGGLIFVIPNMYFGWYAFRYRGAQMTPLVLMSFYRGEIGKFLLSGVGFAIAFTLFKPLDLLWLFSAYSALTVMQWIQLAKIK
jgi:ATP synthase protein I